MTISLHAVHIQVTGENTCTPSPGIEQIYAIEVQGLPSLSPSHPHTLTLTLTLTFTPTLTLTLTIKPTLTHTLQMQAKMRLQPPSAINIPSLQLLLHFQCYIHSSYQYCLPVMLRYWQLQSPSGPVHSKLTFLTAFLYVSINVIVPYCLYMRAHVK